MRRLHGPAWRQTQMSDTERALLTVWVTPPPPKALLLWGRTAPLLQALLCQRPLLCSGFGLTHPPGGSADSRDAAPGTRCHFKPMCPQSRLRGYHIGAPRDKTLPCLERKGFNFHKQ